MHIPVGVSLLAVILLVLANGFFVATEFAIVAVRRSRLEQLAEEGNRRALAAREVISHLDAYIAACQLGITMASLALGWIGEPALADLVLPLVATVAGSWAPELSHTAAVVISFSVITALHIVIGELAPKGIALQAPEGTALAVARPVMLFHRLFRLPITMLNAVGNAVLRTFGLRPSSGHEMVHSVEELRMLVDASQQAGAVEESEARIASRAFRFADLSAGELMTPRIQAIGAPASSSVAEAVRRARQSAHGRIVVYENSMDDIIGVVNVRDLLPYVLDASGPPPPELRALVRPVPQVPASKRADDLLEEMRAARTHLAVVIDEYGGTAGLITLHDVLEGLVGPLDDESDTDVPTIGPVEQDGSRVLSGLLRLSELEEVAEIRVSPEVRQDADTVGGVVMSRLGRMPQPGDQVSLEGRDLRVERVRGRRIVSVRLFPPKAEDGAQPEKDAEKEPAG